ncbi:MULTISPECIES: DUF2523 family protein [Alcaligenes]|uniref:DUF2523 family protein n=1 Tax=Alcaligenes TaxID=507 RepID=UPI0002AAE524|nr:MULTISPECIES: DUF2523 family protein [Alcaligenes]EKU30144.1 putative phage-related membrane protein [Alcaligenes sp. HPC1271]ERI35003.1 hypothetical protein N879_05635 [Alcaligenes sp. EGD-AK7]HRO20789.1 DUF2523 family protein [Alcaligenes phenolicus]HRP13621.1 DUF2523 family protein [Alcaligenes phenolicus]
MFGIILSALSSVLTWVFRSILVKFVLFFALYFITSEFVGFIVKLLPGSNAVDAAFSGIGAATWYFLNVFEVQAGVAMVVSSYTTRFIIRRIPVIG